MKHHNTTKIENESSIGNVALNSFISD